MIIFHHFLNDIFYMTFKKWSCKLKKWWKMTKKKCHLKNDKVEHVLLYHFLNDENHTQIVSPWRKKLIGAHMLRHKWMEAAFAVLIIMYTLRKKAWINFFKLFNYKRLELDFTNLFNHGKNNVHWIVDWSLRKRKMLMGSQLIKNCYKKAKSRKK